MAFSRSRVLLSVLGPVLIPCCGTSGFTSNANGGSAEPPSAEGGNAPPLVAPDAAVSSQDDAGCAPTTTDACAPPILDAGVTLLGGKILFRGLTEGNAFEVEIYLVPISLPALPAYGDGHCDVHPLGQGDEIDGPFFSSPPLADLDLGTVTATNGTVTLTSAPLQGGFQYEQSSSFFAFDSFWTMANSGAPAGLAAGTLASFRVPGKVTPSPPSPIPVSVGDGGGWTIGYGGGLGAQSFHINLIGATASVDCYPSPTTSSFTLPPNVMSAIDASFAVRVWAESRTFVTIGGRSVMLRVTSDNLD